MVTVEFRLLGAVECCIEDSAVDLGPVRQRCVLVALLLNANQVVLPDQLVDRVWGERPPQSVRSTLHSYLSRLRKVLRGAGDVSIDHTSGGYKLTVDQNAMDVHRFRDLITQARAAADDEQALGLFERALAIWRGEAFAGLDSVWLTDARVLLEQERSAASLDHIDVALRCGRHAALVPQLSTMAYECPLDERIAGQLMRALYRNGRQADALNHYQRILTRLADELGTDPSPPLKALHHQILTAEPSLAEPTPAGVTGQRRRPHAPAPCQLPVHTLHFVGRSKELSQLTRLLHPAGRGIGAPAIATISGTAGVGKTALAVHWARRAAPWFPDGQLYADLRGFDPRDRPLRPDEVIRGFLTAFDIPVERIPATLEAQAALYRSLLSDRSVLVVLDNARDGKQVRPLLPSGHNCVVLITSRDRLASLVIKEGARPINMGVMAHKDARALLERFLGSRRTAAEPDAVRELIAHSSRLPLPLAIVAARGATNPGLALRVLASELADEQSRLDALESGDPDTGIRAVLSWSYRTLTQPAARLFRLMGLHAGRDISLLAAASLAGDDVRKTGLSLRELSCAHVLEEHAPGRYRFHDLLRAYAAERASAEESETSRQAAIHRVMDHYLHTSLAAARKLESCRDPGWVPALRPGVVVPDITDRTDASHWFTMEHETLVATAGQAARMRRDQYAWMLPWSLATFMDSQGNWRDYLPILQAALAAAARLGDAAAQARMHRNLGRIYVRLGRHADADVHYQRALVLCQVCDDLVGQAHTFHGLSWTGEREGRHAEALRHALCALDLYRIVANRVGEGRALNSLSWNHILLGDYRQAVTHCLEALDLHQEMDDRAGKAAVLHILGYAEHHLGHYSRAIANFRQSLKLWCELGDRYNEARTLNHLGDTHNVLGDEAAARDTWQQALIAFETLAHPDTGRVRAKLGIGSQFRPGS